jgi:hypothetical protein
MSIHEEVSIAPMPARAPSLPRSVHGLLLALAVAGLAGAGQARGADPPPPGPLDRPFADLALIDPSAGPGAASDSESAAAGPDEPPLLLTLDTVDVPAGSVTIALRDRAVGWEPVASQTVALADPGDGTETPWLVGLGNGRFVILATSHDQGQTAALRVKITPNTDGPIDLGPMTRLAIAVDDAGAIDVDGDGSVELVVASAMTTRGGDVCQSSTIGVHDGTSLGQRNQFAVPGMRLAGGALGEWDGQAGGDLLAYAYGNCPAGPDAAQRLGVVVLRLSDGVPTVAISPEDPGNSATLPGVPLAADLDGDGRDEVVIRDGGALVVVEPARGWTRTEIARGDVLPLAAVGPRDTTEDGVIVWAEGAEGRGIVSVAIATVTRTAGGALGVTSERLDLASVAPLRRARVRAAILDGAAVQGTPQVWAGEVDRDGCLEILAPLFTAECAGTDEQTIEPGAAWLATRPIVAFDARNSRELLVASTVEWNPAIGAPRVATPVAVGATGAWRHGPSSRFALSEVRAADAAYFNRFPTPRPTIERAPVRTQGTDFPGFTGARVLVRVTGALPGDPPPAEAPSLDAFLTDPPASGEHILVARIAVPAGAESGRDGSFVHVALADVELPDGGPAERWTVTIAQLNDWGEVAGPVRGTITLDSTGPSLAVETPFLSLPWPFEATVHGRSEPRVEIRGATAGPVESDRRGRFELRTQLAPWPQSIELTAVDESGNTTTKQFSLVGGVDYRAFPWAAIVAVVLLLGAILSAGRGSRAIREVETMPDSEPLPEIEELPTAGEWPRV